MITKTFQPLAGDGVKLPKDLAPSLLHRFASDEGYTLSPGVSPLLRSLKQPPSPPSQPHIPPIIGVITNSDDRVPSILSALGLRVRPLRFGDGNTDTNPHTNTNAPSPNFNPPQQQEQHIHDYDIDLHAMSYDVGFAKPNRRIFDAAEGLANELAATTTAKTGPGPGAVLPWLKVYVGDEYAKDVVGALGAGWNAVLVDDKNGQGPERGDDSEGRNLQWLGNASLDIFPLGGPPKAVRGGSVQEVLKWLGKEVTRG